VLLLAAQPLDGGVVRHVLDLVESLPRDRFELHVACPRRSELWRTLATDPGVRLHAIAPRRRPAPSDLVSLVRLMRLARRADVIHAHSAKAGFVARLAAALTGRSRRCVFTPHGWSFWAAQGLERRLYRSLERLAAHWCRTIVAVSEQERRAGLEARIGRESSYAVVPNGIDLDRFSADPDPVPGRVLMVGRLASPKRHDLAVEALALLPDVELHLVGDGPLAPRVNALARSLGVEARLHALGPRADVPALLSRAACALLLSEYEGWPLVVMEAMAAGVPVVASAVGGVPELVEHGRTGLLVEPGRVEPVVAALEDLLSDPERARRMGEEGRRVARERLSREAMTARLMELYERALTRRG
jgi:glycosyltransferase involved in cell wall biosynthesis